MSQEQNSGATITVDYVGRTLKSVSILEHEINALTEGGRSASLWLSFGSALFSFAVGIYVNASFQTDFTILATNMTKFVAPFLLILSALCFILGGHSWVKTNKVAEDLKAKLK